MNKQNVRNLYCSVCGNIVPCTKTKKRTVDAFCIFCGKKQKLIDRKSIEIKKQGDFSMRNNQNNQRDRNKYNDHQNRYKSERYNKGKRGYDDENK